MSFQQIKKDNKNSNTKKNGQLRTNRPWDYKKIYSNTIQPKQKISQPNDIYEQEADRIAEQIMQIPTDMVQHQCSSCQMENEELKISRKADTVGNLQVSDSVAQQIDSMSGCGQPLDNSTRIFMESRFGFDFNKIRIHTDEKAAKSAQSVNAIAYTVGNDIVFGTEQYQPHTLEGRGLLAHELTHVVQQRDESCSNTLQRITHVSMEPQIPQMERFHSLINEYNELKNSNKLSKEEILEIDRAIDLANEAIRNAQKTSEKGSTLMASAGTLTAASAALAADDATGIGVADDVALPFTLIAAGILGLTYLATRSSPLERIHAIDAATQAVADAVTTIETTVFAVKVGEQVRSLTSNLIVHLARILGTTVSGQPPDHQGDPERNKNHWWAEIKNFVKQIRDKGLSPKQMWRELTKKFTPQQIAEMKEALRRAAELMKEDPPDFPPTMP